jgi:hypothetical protein
MELHLFGFHPVQEGRNTFRGQSRLFGVVLVRAQT